MYPYVASAVTTFALLLAGLASAVEPEMVTIPGSDPEVNGPTYTYEISKYEITNAEYCTFLNDAELIQQSDPDDPRCTNMWFEPGTGNVYMTNIANRDYRLYWTSQLDSKIDYTPANSNGTRYSVETGFDDHPVGTVSWFGAAKFCNWLTIHAGMDASEICYHEGSTADAWYPITASNWTANGLLDSERLDLVANYRGYRLPMDGINAGTGDSICYVAANPYNEWYKAAAFDPAAPDTVRYGAWDGGSFADFTECLSGPKEGDSFLPPSAACLELFDYPVGDGDVDLQDFTRFQRVEPVHEPDHWVFGYGADTNTNADANLGNHGYPPPFDETTPVGFYDGVHTLFDGTPTNDTRNQYALYDMCGNVAEWVSDTDLAHPWDSSYRAIRGGRWTSSGPEYAVNSVRNVVIARFCTYNNIGFRIVRSP
jgi:formylglycine-generating enzyme required for sulfatase activity